MLDINAPVAPVARATTELDFEILAVGRAVAERDVVVASTLVVALRDDTLVFLRGLSVAVRGVKTDVRAVVERTFLVEIRD